MRQDCTKGARLACSMQYLLDYDVRTVVLEYTASTRVIYLSNPALQAVYLVGDDWKKKMSDSFSFGDLLTQR